MTRHAHTFAHTHQHRPKQQPSYVTMFVRLHINEAKVVSARTGIPTEVILAQSALESDWGRTVNDNAYFGIKENRPRANRRFFQHMKSRYPDNASVKTMHFAPTPATLKPPTITHPS